MGVYKLTHTFPAPMRRNWVTINSFVPMQLLAIEGDVREDADEVSGWTNARLRTYFHQIMKAHWKFSTCTYFI